MLVHRRIITAVLQLHQGMLYASPIIVSNASLIMKLVRPKRQLLLVAVTSEHSLMSTSFRTSIAYTLAIVVASVVPSFPAYFFTSAVLMITASPSSACVASPYADIAHKDNGRARDQ